VEGEEVIEVKQETPDDLPAVREVNEQAFGQPAEANIVEKLRASCRDLLSLVAVDEGQVVGHILFSPATIQTDRGALRGMGLAPMAVLPGRQRQGIGSALVAGGLEILRHRSCPFVIVLGHPEYYPRFGFERASLYGLKSQWDGVPDEAFMVLFLDASVKENVSGVARYRDEFNEAM
jgi:putative acetyltransferase